MRYLFASTAMLAVVLTGCTQADNRIGADTDQNQEGTAMVREMGHSEMPETMEQCNQKMMQHIGEADANYDKRFIDMMTRHHEGAIQMAQDALKNAQHPEIKKLSQNIIEAQQKEIKQLEAWRKEWYGSTASQ